MHPAPHSAIPASTAMSRSDARSAVAVRAAEDHRGARTELGGVAQLLVERGVADAEQDEVDRLVQMLRATAGTAGRRSVVARVDQMDPARSGAAA